MEELGLLLNLTSCPPIGTPLISTVGAPNYHLLLVAITGSSLQVQRHKLSAVGEGLRLLAGSSLAWRGWALQALRPLTRTI